MKSAARLLVGCLLCSLAVLGGAPTLAFGEASSPASDVASSSALGVGLIVTGSPVENEQLQAQAEAQRDSPEAVADREASRTRFHSLNTGQAVSLATKTFPDLIERREGGTPVLGTGEKISRYISSHAAQIALPEDKHALLESTEPIARDNSSGGLIPIDLALKDTGPTFVPESPNVAVRIFKHIESGVEAPEIGVSLIPTDATGLPLTKANGTVEGSSVLYANTQTDTDMVAKPTSRGFEVSTIMRSVDSPRRLYYRVSMPSGARLFQKTAGGTVEILDHGAPIAAILSPNAQDATGHNVPVSMSIDNKSLVIALGGPISEYQWPIKVDPEFITAYDSDLTGPNPPEEEEGSPGGTNWVPIPESSAFVVNKYYHCSHQNYCDGSWTMEPVASYNGGEYDGVEYKTEGESKIYKFEAWVSGKNESADTYSYLELLSHEGIEKNKYVLSQGTNYLDSPAKLCAANCGPQKELEGGYARYLNVTGEAGGAGSFTDKITQALLYISQTKGPMASFNTTTSTIAEAANRQNVLYGGGGWLSPSQGAYEVTATDPGVGVSYISVSGGGMTERRYIRTKEGKCDGAQCSKTYSTPLAYLPSMADGEDQIEFHAEDAAALSGSATKTIKVDATPPYSIGFTGMPENGAEISAAPHTLTIHATDGDKPTVSSGVKSIEVTIDGGQPTSLAGTSCSPGECTASGQYTIYGENLSEGTHRLVVTATDNAGNAGSEEWTFDVRHASPVSVGPGAVDPTTGQFELTATDASLSGTSGVSRVYRSRNLTAGAEGPLGPQWALSPGSSESLTVLPEGNVALISVTGGRTTFARNSKGEFESPPGDTPLKLEAKEPTKGTITEYVMTDAKLGTTTRFTQPAGTEKTVPLAANEFGEEGVELNHPASVAIDASGDEWATDSMNARILKFSPEGKLISSYGSYGWEEGKLKTPSGVAINQSSGNVYVTDESNNRLDEFSSSGTFVKASKLVIHENYFFPRSPKGVAVDSSGDLWVADYGNNSIDEFSSEDQLLAIFGYGVSNGKEEWEKCTSECQSGRAGSGNGQFSSPTGVTFINEHLYISEAGDNRVQELTTAGSYVSQFGKAGSGSGEFSKPGGITAEASTGNLYVTDTGNNRVQEFTAAGKLITKFGTAGAASGQFSEPRGIAISSSGSVYVIDSGNDRVDEWMRSSWLPTFAEGPLSSGNTSYAYTPDEVETGKTVMMPSEAFAPAPVGISCGTKVEEFVKGCRALLFTYSTKTSATGENPTGWGEYDGRLVRVSFKAYNPAVGVEKMEEKPVAEYSYDEQGRLRAEWDPRTSLKTTYGYDTEGHVTAVTAPGQQPWVLTNGTIAGDGNKGRLIKVSQAYPKSGASEESIKTTLTEQKELPEDTGAQPKLSGTPAVGVTMGVSSGSWSHSPVVYGYQWEDCNSSGKECTPILGATNGNYTPASGDVGHTLVAEVAATNGDGSVIASSAASATVLSKAGSYTQAVDSGYSLSAVSCIPSTTDCVLSDSAGKALYATNVSTGSSATWKTWSGPSGESPSQAIDCPTSSLCLLADGKETAGGKLYYATSLGGTFSEAYTPSYGVDTISCVSASFCIDGQDGYGYYRYSTSPASTSWTLEDQAEASMKGAFCLSASFCAIADGSGRVHVATSTSQVESSTWKETDVDGSSALNGIACTSTTSCVAVDGTGNALKLTIESSGTATAVKHSIDGTTSLTAVTCSGSSICVAVDASGNVFASKNAGETWSKEYALGDKLTSVSCASTSLCATADTAGSVTAFNPAGGTGTPGEPRAPEPGTTIEYHVPVSGAGAYYALNKEEVEKWGQKDSSEQEDNDPVEGMAVFAPDEPQGWPASGHKRATVDYVNGKGLNVNTVTPTGGVTTTEYNSANEVVRTLSPNDRATALKEECKSAPKKECKSAETAEKLDSKTEYNAADTEAIKVIGPEHNVKLSTGPEVEAREVTHNYYDEGAKEAEEKFKETYILLTRTTDGALLANGEEKDVRTMETSYSGQGELGWKLRKPTSTITEAAGIDLVDKTLYDENTGDVVETKAPAANSEEVSPPSFALHFGGGGTGNGQFKEPWAVALDSSNNVWALDTGNDRVEKFSSTGSFDAAYGKEGSGGLQLKEPKGIAINQSTGNVYVADSANNRIEELSSAGAFVETIGWGVSDEKAELELCKNGCKAGIAGAGNGQFSGPIGVTIDAQGDIWVVDSNNDRVEELSEAGAYVAQFGSKGSGNGQLTEPAGIAISEGSLYVVDHGNDRVEQFSTAGAYMGQFGTKGSGPGQFSEPYGISSNSSTGVLYVCDTENGRMEEFSPAGKFLTEWGTWGSTHEQSWPRDVAVGPSGNMYIIDHSANEVGEWIPPEAGGAHLSFSTQFGSKGTGNGQYSEPEGAAIDGQGNLWIVDNENNRIEKLSAQGSFLAAYGKLGSGEVQFHGPTRIAINKSTGNLYVTDTWNNRVEELSSSGTYVASFGTSGSGTLKEPDGVAIDSSGDVWVADRGNDRIVEFSSTGTYIAAYGKAGSGEDQFNQPDGIAISGESVYVSDPYNHRVEELTNKGVYVRTWGYEGHGSGEFWSPAGITTDAAGNLYIVDYSADHVEEFSSTGTYKATFSSEGSGEGQLTHPVGDAIDPAGDLYIVDAGDNRIEKWDSNEQAAHDTKTTYYTAKEEATVATCRNRPEWADLPCQTEPVAQPDHGLPEVPVTTIASYNIWDEAETTEEKFGTGSKAVTRTKKETYDNAGRPSTSEETSSPATDTELSKVTNEYNAETGALETQSSTIAGKTKAVTSKYNTLGKLVTYTDAEGNVAKYVYEEAGDDRLLEVSEGKGEEAKSSQAYVYNATNGFIEKLIDSAAGTFTASYGLEGEMTSEIYPNGMCVNDTYNALAAATSIEYVKTRNCAESKPTLWYSDSVVPSIHGESLLQTSTLAKDNYAYDSAGRLLETQETPTGKGCTTRLYAYDEEANRTSLTTREPGSEGQCAIEGGKVQRHTYDEANRLTDEGVSYETFGNMTKVPAADSGEHEIASTYYLDNQVASQKQNEELIKYIYDPLGRTMETKSESEKTKATTTVISHYAGPGNALTWTSEGAEKWTRNIPGIDGALDATEEGGKAPVLQLHDLEGDIVGTAADNETEGKLLSTYNSTDFGVPQPGTTPPKYAWLGAKGVSTEPSLSSGVSTEGGASYVPQVARTLQTAPVVPPGSFPNGPRPGTQFTATVSAASLISAAAEAEQIFVEAEAARQKAHEECVEDGACLGYEDPPSVGYYDQTQSLALYGTIGAGGAVVSALNTLGFLKGVAEKVLNAAISFIVGHFTTEKIENWFLALDKKLGRCVNAMAIAEGTPKESNPMCRVQLEVDNVGEFTVPITEHRVELFSIPNFSDEPKISYCKYERTWCYVK